MKKYNSVLLLPLYPVVLKTHLEYTYKMIEFNNHDVIMCIYMLVEALPCPRIDSVMKKQ